MDTQNSQDKSDKELRVTLKRDIFDKLEIIKAYHGIKYNVEIVSFLITKEYRGITKDE